MKQVKKKRVKMEITIFLEVPSDVDVKKLELHQDFAIDCDSKNFTYKVLDVEYLSTETASN